MLRTIPVKLDERAVVFKDGLPLRALGPGKHTVWGFDLRTQWWTTGALLFDAPAEVRAVIPKDWYLEVTVKQNERAIVHQDGRPRLFLRPGVHRLWKVDPISVEVLSLDAPMPALTKELAAVIPRDEYVDVLVREHERGLFYAQGRLGRTLGPGRYTLWSPPEEQVEVHTVDMRLQQLPLAPQELMTRDKVSLRLTITVEYAIVDPTLAATTVSQLRDTIYLLAQMAGREYVATVTLDELLAGRDAMTHALSQTVVAKSEGLGVRIERVVVKDVILPGDMKTLLNKVIEAEKAAAANVILRREETAATRSLANTAKVLAENPVLLRLKELESLKEIAGSIDKLHIVVARDGMKELLPKGLLSSGDDD
jgi:regulator of protease activity HflC (stomatin/prohibitin superfamily)